MLKATITIHQESLMDHMEPQVFLLAQGYVPLRLYAVFYWLIVMPQSPHSDSCRVVQV